MMCYGLITPNILSGIRERLAILRYTGKLKKVNYKTGMHTNMMHAYFSAQTLKHKN